MTSSITISFDADDSDPTTLARARVSPGNKRRLLRPGDSKEIELDPGDYFVSVAVVVTDDTIWTVTVEPTGGKAQKKNGKGADTATFTVTVKDDS